MIDEADRQKEILNEQLKFSAALADLHRRRKDDLEKILGPHATEYIKHITALKRKLRGIETDYSNLPRRAQLRQTAVNEARQAIRKLNIDHNQIRNVRKKYKDELLAVNPRIAQGVRKEEVASGDKILTPEIRGRAALLGPPYDSYERAFNNEASPPPEGYQITQYFDCGAIPTTGQVWAYAYNTMSGDFYEDFYARTETTAAVVQLFVMPRDLRGRIACSIQMEATEVRPEPSTFLTNRVYHKCVEEGGLFEDSDARVQHFNHAYLKVSGTNDIG
jgi:hypothetical protein